MPRSIFIATIASFFLVASTRESVSQVATCRLAPRPYGFGGLCRLQQAEGGPSRPIRIRLPDSARVWSTGGPQDRPPWRGNLSLPNTEVAFEIANDLACSVPVGSIAAAQVLLGDARPPARWIGFLGVGRKFDPGLVAFLHGRGIRTILGTFGEIDQRARRERASAYLELLGQGIDILATDEPAIALEAVAAFHTAPSPIGEGS